MSTGSVDKQVHDLKSTIRELLSENKRLTDEVQRVKDETTSSSSRFDDLRHRIDDLTQQDHQIDRDRCVQIAKLYQDAWNSLRDHEWRLEIALWSTFMIIIAVYACGGIKALGVELAAPQALPDNVKLWMDLLLWGLVGLMLVGSLAFQFTFRRFECVRDHYIANATARSHEGLAQDRTYKRWGNAATAIKTVASVLVTLALTRILAGILLR